MTKIDTENKNIKKIDVENKKTEENYFIDLAVLDKHLKELKLDNESIDVIQSTINLAVDKIIWYWKGKIIKKRLAFWLKFLSLILIAVATILPIIEGFNIQCLPERVCYQISSLLFITAGSVNLFDRFFGLSSAWIRFIATATAMEKVLHDYKHDLVLLSAVKNNKNNNIEYKLLELSKTFGDDIFDLVIEETTEWANEFRNSISDIEKQLKQKPHAPQQQ